MQGATMFSRSVGGPWAPLAPAVILVCCALVLVFARMATDEGLAWAVRVQGLSGVGHLGMAALGVVVIWLFIVAGGFAFNGEFASDPLLHFIFIMVGVIAMMGVFFCLGMAGRLPTDSMNNHARIEQAVARAGPEDSLANQLRSLIQSPTHASVAQGARLLDQSLRGREMDRAIVAARIIGIDQMDAMKTAAARGWMTPSELDIVQAAAVEMLRSHSHGKSMAWQAAALALTDRAALSRPIQVAVSGEDAGE